MSSPTTQYRRSPSNGNKHLSAPRMIRSNSMRPLSNATSIDATSDFEESRRRPTQGWSSRKENMLMKTVVVEEEEVSDAESFDSLSSRAKFMSDLLSDNDSSIDGRGSFDGDMTQGTGSSYEGPSTPRTPPAYMDEFPMIEIVDDKSPRFRASSMEASPAFAAKVKEITSTTVGPRGPHLFRSYSTSHATSIAHISIPPRGVVMPPTPTASDASHSPSLLKLVDVPELTPPSDSEPIVLARPRSDHPSIRSEYDLEEVRSWATNQVCAWMAALGFEDDLIQKFSNNDITGAILIDLKWDDLKELNIHSFGKRIEIWTEIHHLRARSHGVPSPDLPGAGFVRSNSRISRKNSTGTPTRNRSGSQSSTASQMIGTLNNHYDPRVLPEVPSPVCKVKPIKQEVVSEADDDASDEGVRLRSRPQLRKKPRKTNVRMPRRQISVDSIIITSESEDFPGSYAAKLEAFTSFDDSRRYRPCKCRKDMIVPDDSTSAKCHRKTKCRKHHRHHRQRSSEDTTDNSYRRHNCSKGERCPKQSKSHQRPTSPEMFEVERGTIVIATTPSIADMTSPPRISAIDSIGPKSPRPQSGETSPSVLASSDVLGPIQCQEIQLKESALREISRVDPLENVKQFLTHQHLQHLEEKRDSPPPVPSKSAIDMARAQRSTPSPPPSQRNMTMPTPSVSYSSYNNPQTHYSAPPAPSAPSAPSAPLRSQTPSFGLRSQGMERPVPPQLNFAIPSRVRSPTMMRTTTPFSEADVPCPTGTSFNVRDQSQSVPPDMHLRRFPTPTLESLTAPFPPRSSSRPQMLQMAALDENAEWEAIDDDVKMAPSPNIRTHSGWMKKRRTNWFRHEWPDYHFVLKGTRLGYSKDIATSDVGCIDMDQYQVACSNNGSTKLSAAFKAGRIFGKKKDDGTHSGAYFFQLVPANEIANKGKKNLGKVHYFSVGSREERIDWMRELMLAKAIKQKGQGFKVEVNGELV